MFCNQCMQTPAGGCTGRMGVCGKNEEVSSLQDIIIYGLKGVAAYRTHAAELGHTDSDVDEITQKALYMTLTNSNFNVDEHIGMAMKVGEATVKVMDLLDRAHTGRLGVPEPVTVPQNGVEGHSILVTGHDLLALEELLKQTEGRGINVYTHSEMLPAHGYPGLRKFSHLKGNVGKAWYDQRTLFEKFPGAILATTNCVMPITRRAGYADRMFSLGVAGLEGVSKIENMDFTPLIEKSLSLEKANIRPELTLTTGFHHENVLKIAPEIVEAVKQGKIRRFFVIAGCDAPGKGGEYYRSLARAVPDDCVILTTSCGKFRFNDIDFGTIGDTGIPRFLDLGQCNNSGSAVKIAMALAEAFDCKVNDLPLSIVLSWFEQKAVAILLGLFSLGITDIRIGPRAPEFISEGVLKVLQDTFKLQLTGEPCEDLAQMLGIRIDDLSCDDIPREETVAAA